LGFRICAQSGSKPEQASFCKNRLGWVSGFAPWVLGSAPSVANLNKQAFVKTGLAGF
jgi:hypothetical protein